MSINLFEELVRGAVQADRYLTAENVPYTLQPTARSIRAGRWKTGDTSDIDLIAMRPHLPGPRKVLAINCKGGHEGLNVERDLDRLAAGNAKQTVAGGSVLTGFRELTEPDWQCAFRQRIHAVTGQTEFTHVLAVKRVVGDREKWAAHPSFQKLTPHLVIWELKDLIAMARAPKARLFPNSATRHLVDLLDAA